MILALSGPVVIAVIFAVLRIQDLRTNAENSVIDKSRAIVLMAEATRNQMSKKLQIGIIKPFDQIAPDKVIEAVPHCNGYANSRCQRTKIRLYF